MRHPGAVGVIAVDDAGVVTLVRQFRGPMGRTILEMPAGTQDVEGEPAEETARRELAEEAGLSASRMELLGAAPGVPGGEQSNHTVFLATGLTEGDTDRDGPEERAMTIERVRLRDVVSMAAAGELIDAPTLAAGRAGHPGARGPGELTAMASAIPLQRRRGVLVLVDRRARPGRVDRQRIPPRPPGIRGHARRSVAKPS